ncbi:MAG: non-ribosomal peptide synthetase, partial [Marivirga sp.]|nr:non-ribosomal peptide synthetase [Marivirga sp.]
MNLVDVLLDRSKQNLLGITFIKSSNQEDFVSYSDLFDLALRVLFSLQTRGITAGDELVLQIEDNKNFLVTFWACILGGIVPVPLLVGRNDDQRKKLFQVWSLLNNPFLIISHGDLKQLENYAESNAWTDQLVQIKNGLLFIEDAFESYKEGHIHRPGEMETAFIQFSSGSTGSPKGIVLTHANVIANVKGISSSAAYSATDSMLSWMPLTHDMGMIGFHINPLFCGLSQCIISTGSFVRNPSLWLEKVSQHKISITCSPNFGYRYLLKYLNDDVRDWDLSSVRIIYNGAEPISERLCQEFNERLSKYGLSTKAMCPVYGLAEASVAVSMSDLNKTVQFLNLNRNKLSLGDRIEETDSLRNSTRIVNVGKPVDYCSVLITNKKSQRLAESIVGQIRIKGDNVTSHYY